MCRRYDFFVQPMQSTILQFSGLAPVFRSALLQLAFRLQFRESNRMTGFMRIVPSSRHTGYFRTGCYRTRRRRGRSAQL
jgi:hypothetical protein